MTRRKLYSEFNVFLPLQSELGIVFDKIVTGGVDIPSTPTFPFIPIYKRNHEFFCKIHLLSARLH